ncbi:MAG: phosphoribosylanthranilate isomerase [Chloroflexota bacterium]|nr:phosphoribosylanthranilate isomerase [Dehalococcoidia bacterium]MDW8254399.1 phosphoribosylanthranilate isomerase [Chloroflexota bacterium]
MSVAVKICGLRDPAAVEAAVEAGAEFIGFVFAPSPRRVAPEEAAALRRRVPRGGPQIVGVFVNEAPATVRAIADTVGLDIVQLCGAESPQAEWGRPVIRAIRPAGRIPWRALAPWVAGGARLLVDSFKPGTFGGSGELGDWGLAARIARRWPILLAGGLRPDNVAAAIAAVRPWGVDVSSGVETAGRKDPAKIRAFVDQARAAFPKEGERR